MSAAHPTLPPPARGGGVMGQTETLTGDDWLIDHLAMVICYAGFSGPQAFGASEYWTGIAERPRTHYRREAAVWLQAMRGGREYRLVPTTLTPGLRDALTGRGARTENGARNLWRDALAAVPSVWAMVEVDDPDEVRRALEAALGRVGG